MTEALVQDQVRDTTTFLQAEIKTLQSQLQASQATAAKHQSHAQKLTDELATLATGDVEAIRQTYEQRYAALQHNAGLSALKAALVDRPDVAEIADAIVLKGGKRFGALEDGSIVLFDADGTPAVGDRGRYIQPSDAAKQVLEKFEPKSSAPGLQAWRRDSQGRVIVPRSQSLDRRAVQTNLPIEDFDSGNWIIVDDAKLGRHQPTGSVARQLQQVQSSKVLEIRSSELPAARDWCRRHSVDPHQFESMVNNDRIKVIAG